MNCTFEAYCPPSTESRILALLAEGCPADVKTIAHKLQGKKPLPSTFVVVGVILDELKAKGLVPA